MGGININQKHNLINNSKSPLFYTLISVIILAILTIIAISIKLSFSNAAEDTEGANDTGVATLNNVDILQAGTGQSVTIKGETLNENDYGTGNTTRRTILNNNVVRYSANYNVTKVGQVTFSITLPANNTIDEATIAESQGCLQGLSKLESADITNSDGTITKSYTNNKATCVRNITATGSINWQIAAYLWGANNTRIQPTLAASGASSNIKPEAISVVGKPNYEIRTGSANYNNAFNGIDKSAAFYFVLYTPYSETDVLGLEPLSSLTFNIDTSNMPRGWSIDMRDRYAYASNISQDSSTAYSGEYAFTKESDSKLTLTVKGIVTAARKYPSVDVDHKTPPGYVWSSWRPLFTIPVSSIAKPGGNYSAHINVAQLSNNDASVYIPTLSLKGFNWYLSSVGSAQADIGAMYNSDSYPTLPGWDDTWNWLGVDKKGKPFYAGLKLSFMPMARYPSIPTGNHATDLNFCLTWDSKLLAITDEIIPIASSFFGDDVQAEYGVIKGGDVPDSSSVSCGTYGDVQSGVSFYPTVEEALANLSDVNAVRLRAAEFGGVNSGDSTNWPIARASHNVLVDNRLSYASATPIISTSISASEWPESSIQQSVAIVPGLLSHTLTAEPSSTNPGKEDHITITTKTYNKDTNSKITINLPNGLIPKEGSFTITTGYEYNDETNTNEPIKAVLIEGEGQDYTITSSSDGDYAITLDLDHITSTHHVPITGYDPIYPGESGVTNIALESNTGLYKEVLTTNNNNTDDDPINDDLPIAADNDGNGISHIGTPIEFDVTVNEDTPSPSTLTINSTASGTGTDYVSTTFKTASDTIAVAEPPKTFGYDLTTSSNNIYAGDDLAYSYSISNTTDTNATNIQMLTVLPFNGDSRGTTGLKNLEGETTQASSSSSTNPSTITNPYTISHLSLSLPSDGASGLDTSATKLYYTLDPKAHELESNPEALALDGSITWQELELASDGNIPADTMTNLQQQGVLDSITALKLTSDELPSSNQLRLNVTLDNILATTPSTKATLANDITYLSYTLPNTNTISNTTNTNTNIRTILRQEDDITTYSDGQVTSIHQNPNTVNYLGELLALSIPEGEQTIQVTLGLNDVVIGNPDTNDDSTHPVNHLSLTTATLRGYTLTAQTSTEDGALLTEQEDARSIPAISTEPTTGTAGWSAKIAGSNNQSLAGTTWTAIPGSNQTPLNLYTSTAKGRDNRTLTITYGVSAANTIADTYSARVVYTVTAEP